MTLLDDGTGSDLEANDGIYSGQWVPTATGTNLLFMPVGIVTVQVITPYVPTITASSFRTITGTNMNLPDDGSSALSPFTIRFGGGSINLLLVNENVNLSLTGSVTSFANKFLPIPESPTLISPWWDDLIADAGGVFFQVTGTTPNRELVIEWRNYGHFECPVGPSVTFQVVFF